MNVTWNDLFFLLPMLSLFVFSCVPITLKVMRGNQEPDNNGTLLISLMGIFIAAGISLFQWRTAMVSGPVTAFGGVLIFDKLSLFSTLCILLVASLALILSSSNWGTRGLGYSEHSFLVLLSTIGMMILNSSSDLIVAFVGLEMMSIALYILIALSHEQILAKEAAFKYFLLGSFASAIFLYGVAMIYGTTGSTDLGQVAMSTDTLGRASALFAAGSILLLVGVGFKVSMFPFHVWTPDVYQGAPTAVTGFMATGVKVAMFTVFMRIASTDMFLAHPSIANLIGLLAVFTILVGNISAIVQDNIKRMLAYSSIAHAGYLLVGIVASLRASDGSASSATLFYLLGYSLMNIGAFSVVSLIEKEEGGNLSIASFSGLGYKYPILGLCMSVFIFSLAGLPPTVGFIGKFYIFAAALKEGYTGLAVFGVIGSLISVYYYLRIIMYLYMKEEVMPVVASEDSGNRMVMGLTALATLALGIFAAPFYSAAVDSVTSLFK